MHAVLELLQVYIYVHCSSSSPIWHCYTCSIATLPCIQCGDISNIQWTSSSWPDARSEVEHPNLFQFAMDSQMTFYRHVSNH